MSLLSVEAARAAVLARVSPLESERIPLEYSIDKVLAEPIVAARDLPAYDDSAMDGYAVRAADSGPGVRLPVVDHIAAGDPGDRPLPGGGAARIFTGALLPPGADAVVMEEDTTRDGDHVILQVSVSPGENVRRAGNDVAAGTQVLRPGRVLSAGDLVLLAGLGRTEIEVFRSPRVWILCSGDELVEVGGTPRRGQVVAGVGLGLSAAVTALGAWPHVPPIVRDDAAATRAAIEQVRSDVLITVGGMSVGDHDHVAHTLKALCGDALAFHKVAIKPGKPFAFGMLGNMVVFGLPGNPVSALVTFEIFVRPALLRMQGHERVFRRPVPAVLAHDLPAGGSRTEYHRAQVAWVGAQRVVDARRKRSSGAMSSLSGADALLPVPIGAAARAAGEPVEVLLLGPDAPVDRLSYIS